MPYERDHAEYEDEDQEDGERTTWFTKFWDTFTRRDDHDDEFEDETIDERKSSSTLAGHDPTTVARVPAPTRHAGGSLNPIRRTTVTQMRVEREQNHTVTVRRTVQSFEDVRRAVDGLREGVQQIVNIEQTPPDIAERLIDFLNGATYALDGSVEKIGSQVYLFTPSSVIIDIEDKAKSPVAKPFFDRE